MRAPLVLALAALAAPAYAQQVTLPAGQEIMLVTAIPLSSKTKVKGDQIPLKTSEDVRVDGQVVIPAGTEAVGIIADARAKGAMGMSGKLAVAPLYLSYGGQTIRLTGALAEKQKVKGDTIAGVAIFNPVLISGRSAAIPAGAAIRAVTVRETKLTAITPK